MVLPEEVVGCHVNREKDGVNIITRYALLIYDLASGKLNEKRDISDLSLQKPLEDILMGEGNIQEAVVQQFCHYLDTYQSFWTPFICRKLFKIFKESFPPHLYDQLPKIICQSPDRHFIAYQDAKGDISVWNVRAQQKVGILPINQQDICCMALGAFDQRYQLVISFSSKVLQIWEIHFSNNQFQFIHTITLQSDKTVLFSLFSKDGRFLYTSRKNRGIAEWDLQSKKKSKEYQDDSLSKITEGKLDFDIVIMGVNEEKGLLVGAAKHTIYLWNIFNGELIRKIILTETCIEVVLSQDAEYLIVNGFTFLSVWKLVSKKDKLDAQLLWQKTKPKDKFYSTLFTKVSEDQRIKTDKTENIQLERLIAEQVMNIVALKDVLSKKG